MTQGNVMSTEQLELTAKVVEHLEDLVMDKGYRNTPTGWRPVYVCRACGAPSVAGSDVRCKPCGYVGKTRRNK